MWVADMSLAGWGRKGFNRESRGRTECRGLIPVARNSRQEAAQAARITGSLHMTIQTRC